MNLSSILSGETSDRHNRANHPMTESEARAILIEHDKHMPKSRRGSTIRKIVESPFGRLSDEARALYIAYAEYYGS